MFEAPQLAGFGSHWPLEDYEAKFLSEPTDRVIKRMSPGARAAFAKFWDPIVILGGLGMLIATRYQMTELYLHQKRIQREVEVRRAVLAESDAGTDRTGVPRQKPPAKVDGELHSKNPNGQPEPNAENGVPGGHKLVQDVFDTGG